IVRLVVQAWENRRAFALDGVESVGIEAEDLQDGGSHLSGLHKGMDGPPLDRRIRYQEHHVRIVPSVAAMLGLLFQAARVDNADVRQHDDIGCAGIAAFALEAAGTRYVRHSRKVKEGGERIAVENLTQTNGGPGL